jgi:formylglycine-generating enzyme required for sulfatase activity
VTLGSVLVLLATAMPHCARAQQFRIFRISAPVPTTITSVSPTGTVTWTSAATGVTCTFQTSTNLAANDWTDYVRVPISNAVTTLRLFDPNPPAGMVLIPSGSFTMGDPFAEGYDDELPEHTVYVNAFYMDRYPVTKALWDEVKTWGFTNGYSFAGSGKGTNHPVQGLNWFNAVAWCNARSQKEGLVPCYYTDAALTTIYKVGQVNPYVKWNATGYRLPTEAEWEKAARGGANGHRFAWADADTISHSRANYNAANSQPYDLSYPAGYHPDFATNSTPYTSPVGCFAPNNYGLYDMVGNVWQWCWDWYQADWYNQSAASQSDTRGPAGPLDFRVERGGSWADYAIFCRASYRNYYYPTYGDGNDGFRCARGL